tara:strand:- start:31252 stop:32043 length:792 start_codon:yes stop_codon:yes gene_type:complete
MKTNSQQVDQQRDALWNAIFDNYGIKTVTSTDKKKSAYVVNQQQLEVFRCAGITELRSGKSEGSSVRLKVPFETETCIEASLYEALRDENKRVPETRMGRSFIREWLSIGDEVLIGHIGPALFAIRPAAIKHLSDEEVHLRVMSFLPTKQLYERARHAPQAPCVREVTRSEYIRSPEVVAATLMRAGGSCEMPSCKADLFLRDDSSFYLEVHHVTPLAEKGADSTENTAALCPRCHREQHSGSNRQELRRKLRDHIKAMHPDP